MLPIALTCPVWWVARWIARTLASLAVLAACSFGAAALPVGGAATAPVASSAVAPVEGLALPPGAAARHLGDGAGRTVAGHDFRYTARRTVAGPDFRAAAGPAAGAHDAGSGADLDRAAVPADGHTPMAATRPADRPVVLAGLVPATVGSRAPPAR
ncbi:hypothetical protein [Micromonospora chersina]|uniref:Uncharacterized protein n=1 Tax=Micromonospora chersina TaxID=47854 RepID=A0A1C6UMN6_9ACTN|nr:hypothetical protein [Micromonospora chersina]SCL55280.1 hypothetical protein GA0070603_1974 [Micromonospora chersina]